MSIPNFLYMGNPWLTTFSLTLLMENSQTQVRGEIILYNANRYKLDIKIQPIINIFYLYDFFINKKVNTCIFYLIIFDFFFGLAKLQYLEG